MFKTYFRLMGFARPVGRYAFPYLICSLLYALFNTFTYVAAIPVINTIFQPDFVYTPVEVFPDFEVRQEFLTDVVFYVYPRFFAEFDPINILMMMALLLICIALLSNLFRYLGSWIIEKMRTTTLQRMRNDLFDRVVDLDVGYFSDQRKGDIMSRITQDVMVVQFCITNTLQVIREPFLIIGYITAMLAISWQLSIFSILFLPVVALIVGGIVKRLRHPALRGQERMGDMVSVLDEMLAGVKIVKSYNAEGYVSRKFHAINAEFSRLMLSMARRQQLASPMSEFLGISAVCVVLIFGGRLVMDGTLNAGSFVIFIGMFSQITRPARSIVDQFANVNQGVAAGERILKLLDRRSAVTDRSGARELRSFERDIELRDVRFSYDGSREVIRGISFTIRKGETVALVGPSGGGKSTLSELIPRFYDPQSGDILIDGVSIREYTQSSLRAHMSVVAQDTVLFNDTIEGNIALGKPGATHEEVVAAAKVANAHDFIRETELGYGTNIGDRGVKLSGGQRQRLSIARAVLKNPEILILDEATSALDTESEKLVQDALNSLMKERTSIVIAHRLSTVHNADRIVVIDHGRVAEQGTHDELMRRGGIYAKLIEMQSVS